MKQKILMLLSLLVISVTAMGQTAVKPAGSGTNEDPYQITIAENLVWIREYIEEHYRARPKMNMILLNDIDMSTVCHPADPARGIEEVSWTSIGNRYYSSVVGSGTTDYVAFQSTFDGQGFSIYNLYQNMPEDKVYGLFGRARNATIKNVHLKNVNIVGSQYEMGALVSVCDYQDKIINCSVSGVITTVPTSYQPTGGLVGLLSNYSSISSCTNNATVNGQTKAGGIVGESGSNCYISLCENNGEISGTTYVGGIAGTMKEEIISCVNNAMITATNRYAGGIVGESKNSVTNCKNTAMVRGVDYVAGITPYTYYIQNCLNTGDIIVTTDGKYFGLLGSSYSSCRNSYYTTNATISKNGQMIDPCASYYISVKNLDYDASANSTQMRSGEITYLLQQNQETVYWKQNLGVDKVPQLNLDYENRDYMVVKKDTIDCRGVSVGIGKYRNGDSYDMVYLPHVYDDDYCSVCHKCAEPEFVDGVYRIKSSGNLWWFKDAINRSALELKTRDAELAANIDLAFLCENLEPWTAIGGGTNMYMGTFDGKGYVVRNLTYNNSKDTNRNGGLFGSVYNSTIKNVKVIGNSTCQAGGLLAYSANKSTLENCYVNGSITCSAEGAGGMIGFSNLSEYNYCVSYVDVTGTSSVGGLIGKVNTSTDGNELFYCASYGTLTGTSNVGGLIGATHEDVITNSVCYAPHASGFEGSYYKGDGTKVSQTKQQMNSGETLEAMADNNWFQEPIDVAPALGIVEGFKHYQVNCYGHEIVNPIYAYYTRDDSEVRIYNGDGHYNVDGFCIYCKDLHHSQEDGYYFIDNVEQLKWWITQVQSGKKEICARQTADINLKSICHPTVLNQKEVSWVSIPTYYGHYDGQGHKISGLYQRSTTSAGVGLFQQIGTTTRHDAKISNLIVEGEVIVNTTTAGSDGASLICTTNMGTIEGCEASGSVTSNREFAGGITADNYGGIVTDCINRATIASTGTKAGGIAGASSGQITRCLNYGSITSTVTTNKSYYFGGIVGYSDTNNANFDNAISYCANYGELKVPYVAGGICGSYRGTRPIVSCYNMANVSSTITQTGLTNNEYFAQRRTVVNGISQNTKSAKIERCYYNSGYSGSANDYAFPLTNEQFASGELAYLLGEPWGQNITNAPKDAFPVLDGPKVYFAGSAYFNALDNSINALVKLIDKMNAGNATKADVENMVDKLLEK